MGTSRVESRVRALYIEGNGFDFRREGLTVDEMLRVKGHNNIFASALTFFTLSLPLLTAFDAVGDIAAVPNERKLALNCREHVKVVAANISQIAG